MSLQTPLKKLADDRIAINLGCGTRVAEGWNNLDFSPYARLARRRRLASLMRWMGLFSEAQWHAIQSMNGDTVARDLRKGAPFESNTFDIVYHSHVLEHLDRKAAFPFLRECLRMLKSRGRLRCVVPDLEVLIKRYGDAVAGVDAEEVHALRHYDRAVDNILEQMVRTRPGGRENHGVIARTVQDLVYGDPHRTGELHRWMYDRISLPRLLRQVGFVNVECVAVDESRIDVWNTFGLDKNSDGVPHKRNSLYVEGEKPAESDGSLEHDVQLGQWAA